MRSVLLSFFILLSFSCFAQEEESDSLKTLDEVTVRAFEQDRKASSTTASVKFIQLNNGDRNNKTSLVSGFNTVAGVRMEERSPGSYRINIRGSSLRSPFGVRNVKVYWNNIPITDPGGNTYFNQFAWNNFSYLEIFKGPAGSMYGAGTGGLILMYTLDPWHPGTSFEYITGSSGLQNVFTSARFGKKENQNQITYSHNQNDGYRVQSSMRRNNFSWQSVLKTSDRNQLSASVLFTDMYYQTPGALTLAEFNADPKAARPAAGAFPSAVNARAAIFQKNLTTGFTNTHSINSRFKNTTTLYGAFNQVKNAAIRNHERRNEPSFGGRTLFSLNRNTQRRTIYNVDSSTIQFVAGAEFQQGYFNTQVSQNRNGQPDTLQTNDDVKNTAYSFFIQADLFTRDGWFVTAGISLNKTQVEFSRLSSYPVLVQKRKYQNELAPRISIKKRFENNLSIGATISRGFSPPTIAELLPSTSVISTDLEAEYGWNYELQLSAGLFRNALRIEATGFYFDLKNALIQRRDLSGADFFVNAGNVKEKGLEISLDYSRSFRRTVFDYIILQTAVTLNQFRYGDFSTLAGNFSGNKVPSVPCNTISGLADLHFKKGFYLNLSYYSAARIWLNDANTATADPYQLLGARIGWKKSLNKKYRLNFYAGADNLFDQTYSLGNDINAAANRFYNAAPRRNYYLGVAFQWMKGS
jgi:iron complex outermembrane recepter protein